MWFLEAFGAIGLLAGTQYAVTTYSPATGNDGLLVFFSVIAIWLGIGGLAGSSGEVIFGTHTLLRFFFGATLAGLIIAFSFNGAWTEILGSASTIAALIGGNAMLVRQIIEQRRMKDLVHRFRNDILKGTVWCFERVFPSSSEDLEMERHAVEVLPQSKILVKLNDTDVPQPMLVRVTEIATGGTGALDAPSTHYEVVSSSEHFDLRQRHLTAEEQQELSSLLKRALRRLLVRAVALLWAFTATANGLDSLMTKQPPHLNGKSVLIALVFVTAFTGKRLAALRRIREDLMAGIVIVVRGKQQDTQEISFERLPKSNLAWSDFGAPAEWRTSRA